MKKTQDFTQGAIVLPLIRFALPVLAALFLQTMYGAVDLLVVGQYASAADVSAVSTGSQLMQTMTVLISGLAMGIMILIGQYMGQKAPERAAKAIGGGIWLFSIVAVIMTGAILLLAEPMAALLQAPQEAFVQTVDYIRICAGLSCWCLLPLCSRFLFLSRRISERYSRSVPEGHWGMECSCRSWPALLWHMPHFFTGMPCQLYLPETWRFFRRRHST